MASRFYGINVGGMQPNNVTESASTTSSAVELQIDLAKVSNPMYVHQMLEAIKNYLRTKESNPIA